MRMYVHGPPFRLNGTVIANAAPDVRLSSNDEGVDAKFYAPNLISA
jgi:hypothetical protein